MSALLPLFDIKHLPKLQTGNGERHKRHLFVPVDHCSRAVHLAVEDDETERSAIAFWHEIVAAFPFQLDHGDDPRQILIQEPSRADVSNVIHDPFVNIFT